MPRAGRLPRRPQPVRDLRRLVAVLGPDLSVAGQSLVALALNSSTSLVAGAILGAVTGTLAELPGLLVLVPGAIGLRGNVFSALGSRLSTGIHTGTFRVTLRRGTLVGDNVVSALVLTSALSLGLAVLAKIVAVGFGVRDTISVLDLATISIVGGMAASLVVLVATILVAAGAARWGWDLDNLVAPVVSMLGDVLTLPALVAATALVGHGTASTVLGAVLAAAALALLGLAMRTKRELVRGIVRQSWPVLVGAALLSTLAGVVIEKRLSTFGEYPALLVLVPAFVSSAGALGGILASRLGTGLHLGVVAPAAWPGRQVRHDVTVLATVAGPVYLFNAVGAHVVGRVTGQASPGLATMVAATMLGAVGAVGFVVAVAYAASVVSFRAGADPDTYGIPLVTSSVDFAGATVLILAIAAVGLA